MMYKLVLLVSIFILILIVYKNNPEHFENPDNKKNNNKNNNKNSNSNNTDKKPENLKRVVCNIIPGFNNDYVGTFFPEKGGTSNTLITTKSLESNKWMGPIKNGSTGELSVIVDLTYDKLRHLMCVSMVLKGGDSKFHIYRKQTPDITSKWIEIPSNTEIRSLLFDTDGKLMGCGSDGQIYKKTTEDFNNPNWDGPINFDIPMKKIFYDKDLYLLGIGLEDNKLYKKRGFFWSEENWDTNNINDEQIYDAFHSLDGRLIATSHRGILKQKNADFMSPYFLLSEYPREKTEKILNKNDVFMFRTGLRELTNDKIIEDISDNGIILETPLQRILDFKRNAKKVCKNKVNYMSKKVSDNYSNILLVNKQAKTIDNLENLISQYENSMDYRVNFEAPKNVNTKTKIGTTVGVSENNNTNSNSNSNKNEVTVEENSQNEMMN